MLFMPGTSAGQVPPVNAFGAAGLCAPGGGVSLHFPTGPVGGVPPVPPVPVPPVPPVAPEPPVPPVEVPPFPALPPVPEGQPSLQLAASLLLHIHASKHESAGSSQFPAPPAPPALSSLEQPAATPIGKIKINVESARGFIVPRTR